MSDIHGRYDKFKKLLKKIQFSDEDELYILGDVIDRGPAPIEALIYIMSQENITLLLGNHEHMMYNAIMSDYNQKEVTLSSVNEYYLWYCNGGEVTDNQYEDLSNEEKDDILDYIERLPIVIPELKVKDKSFYLAHAYYINNPTIKTPQNLLSLSSSEVKEAIWTRSLNTDKLNNPDTFKAINGQTLIVGHTPTLNYKEVRKTKANKGSILYFNSKHYINIDCGCAYPDKVARLGCLRLDDMKEFYI